MKEQISTLPKPPVPQIETIEDKPISIEIQPEL
jgi:hypothetical protein